MPELSVLFAVSLLLTTAACGFMTGLVVFVDVVHYPGFRFVDSARGQQFHSFHTRFTGWVVGAPMLLEIASGGLLPILGIMAGAPALMQTGAWLSLLLLLGVWAETGLRVVPRHHILQQKGAFTEQNIQALVRSNRRRTLLWGARFFVLLFMLGFLLF